jgi:hypothetical protein
MGDVCDKWDIQYATGSEIYGAHMEMVQTCGDQGSTQTFSRSKEELSSWILFKTKGSASDSLLVWSAVLEEIHRHGLSFHLFKIEEGGFHYFYIEPEKDGEGMY